MCVLTMMKSMLKLANKLKNQGAIKHCGMCVIQDLKFNYLKPSVFLVNSSLRSLRLCGEDFVWNSRKKDLPYV
jgi:hypothetical protein